MLRTTNKLVIEKLREHILENFQPENYGNDQPALQNLRDQIHAMAYGGRSIYQIGLDYVEGGSLLVYYTSQREFLRRLLDETQEEADRYSDDKVFKLYCHLVAREIAKLYEMGAK